METISIVLIISIIIATVCALLFVKPNPKNRKRTVTKVYDDLHAAVNRYNELIRQYNQTNESYLITMQKVERNIILCNDFEAQDQLQSLVSEYESVCNVANDYIKRSNGCINEHDVAGAFYCMDSLKNALSKMDNITRSFQKITPKMNHTIEEPKIVEAKPTLQFFRGCNSKEEIDARYRSLAKAFHPDCKGGDETLFRQMIDEYKTLEAKV